MRVNIQNTVKLTTTTRSFFARCLLVIMLLASTATQAAITFVNSSSVNSGGTPSGTSIVIPTPAGTVDGTFLILQVAIRASFATTISPPVGGGWTSLRRESNSLTISSEIFYKFAGAAEPATHTFTLSAGARFVAGMLAYNGVHTTSPIDVHAGQINASNTNMQAPSVTENFDNDREIWFYSQARGELINNTPPTSPTVGTVRINEAGGAGPNGAAIMIADRQQTTAVTTGVQQTTTVTPDISNGQTVVLRPALTGPDHYAISYPLGQPGVTCEAQAIRITAHASATDHTLLIAPSNTTKITLTTTPAANSWAFKASGAGAPGVFNNLGGGAAEYTFNGTEQFVEFWLTRTTITTAPHIDIDVTDGTATDVDPGAEDARAQFNDTAFRFFADNVAEGIGPQISGKSSTEAPGNQSLQLRAVQTSTTTGACQAALTAANTPVELAFTCNDPTTCHVSLPTPLTITAAATQSIAGSPNAGPLVYTSVNMNFAGTGVAPFSINYADAGQITLSARKVLTATGTTTPPTTSFTLLGNSNSFKVKPAGICVESTTVCLSGDATCSAFVKAGDGVNPSSRFNLIVKAVTWESAADTNFCSGVAGTNLTTPNFQLSNIPLTHTKIRPTGVGTQNGNLAVTTVSLVVADNGTKTITNQAISEVGVFTITATPPLYLTDQAIAASTSANIGRFFPHRFTVTDNTPGFANACTTGATPFTYMDQTFYYGTAPVLTVTALNTAGGVTSNYGGDTSGPNGFWKFDPTMLPSLLDRSYLNQAGAAAIFTLPVNDPDEILTGHTDFDGIGTLGLENSTNGDAFEYARVIEEAPFAANVDLTFSAAGLTDSDGACYDPDNNSVCDAYPITGVGGALLRFGRLVIGTGFGSELLPVPVPMGTEYFDGTSFITNTDDVCTNIALVDHMRLSNPDTVGVQAGTATMTIDGGTTSITVFNSPLVNGNAATRFSAPGSENVGFVNIAGNLDCLEPTIPCVGPPNAFLHLLYDWADTDGLGDGPYDDNPAGRVDFGVYEGPRTHIYTREPW